MMPDYAYTPTVYQSKSNPYFSNLAKFGPKGAGAQENCKEGHFARGSAAGGPSQGSIGCCIAVWFFQRKALDASRCSRIIYLDDARPDHRDPPSATRGGTAKKLQLAALISCKQRVAGCRLKETVTTP
jgi:hypothetical protein